METQPQVTAVLVRKLVEHLVAHGIPRPALLEAARLSPALLRPYRLWLPWVLVEDLIEAAVALTGDDRLGFHLVRQHDLETLGLPGMLFFASRTVGVALRRLTAGARLWTDAYDMVLDERPDVCWYRFVLHRPPRPALAQLRENHLASFRLVMRQLLGPDPSPRRVRLPHACSGEVRAYEDWFGCPVEFGAGETALALEPALMVAPMPTANPLFAAHFDARLRAALARLRSPQDVTARLRIVFEEALAGQQLGDVSVESAALQLQVAPRSLQRALRRKGTGFRDELAAFRRAEAERMLQDGADIAEVSWRLGYAEPSVFHRAFKRWTGLSPEAWRAVSAESEG